MGGKAGIVALFILSVFICSTACSCSRKICYDLEHPAFAYCWDGKTDFDITKASPVNEFPMLNIRLSGNYPDKLYRADGPVESVSEHFVQVMEEAGCRPMNKGLFLKYKSSLDGCCYRIFQPFNGREYAICITFYKPTGCKALDILLQAHEEMHAIQGFDIDEAYGNLEKRFKRIGLRISFEDFNFEEQAYMAGYLRLIELGLPIKNLLNDNRLNQEMLREIYEKMMECKIK
jgi:hypothetical protein